MTIRAVFFDYGGVIGHFDEEWIREFEREQGLRYGDILKALYRGSEWMQAEVGTIDEASWFKAGVRRIVELGGRLSPEGLRDAWAKSFLRLDRQVVALAVALSTSYQVGLLCNSSNSQRSLEDKLARLGILDMWHAIVNSANVGVAKPDERIYHIAARKVGVPPSECVHIDDKQENVAGARAAGFHAIHHNGDYAALEERLRELGIDTSL
jgi:putative hydrolase of the HAD superfamily